MTKKISIIVIIAIAFFALLQCNVFASETLPEAVNGVITLTEDVTLAEGFIVNAGENLTLNLNGKTLSMLDSSGKWASLITNNGTLNIVGPGEVVFESEKPDTSYSYATNTITNNGTLTVQNVTLTNNTAGGASYVVDNDSAVGNVKLIVEDGAKLVGNSSTAAIRLFARSKENTNDVVVNGGEIIGYKYGIIIHCSEGNHETKLANVEINGGKIQSNNGDAGFAIYSYSNGANYDGIKVNISAGTFVGYVAFGGGSVNGGTGSEEVNITGGNFNKIVCTFNSADANIKISGGKFDVVEEDGCTIKDYVVDGKTLDSNGNIVCDHKPTKTPAKEPTYTTEGNIEYYTCSECKKLFKDEACTTETNAIEVIIPMLIQVNNGGNATVEGVVINDAIKDSGNSSVVELPAIENATSVTLPVESLKDVVAADKGLVVETTDATVTLDAKALEEVVKQTPVAGSMITIEVTQIEEKNLKKEQQAAIKDKDVAIVISAKILSNGDEISNFNGGKVKVEIPFTPAEGTKGSDYKIYYIADDGKVEAIPTRYVKGKLVVELEHFSEYVVVKEVANAGTAAAPAAPAANPNEKDNTPKTGAISVIGLVVAMSVIGLAVLRKRD